MQMILAVAAGGALGAVSRYLVGKQALHLFGPSFPWGTLTVNIVGAFIMGIIVEASALRLTLSPELRAFLTVGLLGGFTTFSAFSLDVAVMIERNDFISAILYILTSVIFSILALFAGLALIRSLPA